MPITRTQSLWLLLFILSLLSACVHPYVEPADGPRASLRFVSLKASGPGDVYVHAVTDERCKADTPLIAILSGPAPKHQRKRLDMPLGQDYADQDTTEVMIRADVPYTFDFYWWIPDQPVGMNSCNVTTAFRPMDGHFYEARYTLGRNACAVDMVEITQNEDGQYRREIELSAIRTGNQCKW